MDDDIYYVEPVIEAPKKDDRKIEEKMDQTQNGEKK